VTSRTLKNAPLLRLPKEKRPTGRAIAPVIRRGCSRIDNLDPGRELLRNLKAQLEDSMALGITELATNGRTNVRDRAVEAVRHAAQVTKEARLFKALAPDAVEERVHAARRAITRGMHDLEDFRDSAAYRVKRAPLLTVGLAVGAGMLIGVIVGWIGGRARGSKDAWRVVSD